MNDVTYDSAREDFVWPEIGSEPVRALALHWSALSKNGRAPLRAHFTPLDLPARGWKHLYLIDICPHSGDFLLRVHGTYLVDAAGDDFTGRRLNEDEIPGSTRTALFGLLRETVARGLPQYYNGPTLFRPPNWMRDIEQVLCPLADAQGRVVSIIGAAEFAEMRNPAETVCA